MAGEKADGDVEQTNPSTDEAIEATDSPETTQKPADEGAEPKPKDESTDEGEPQPKAEPEESKGLVVTLDDPDEEAAPPSANPAAANKAWAEVRKKAREAERRAQEAEAKLAALAKPAIPQAPTLPPKPRLSDPEIDFDEEKLVPAMERWVEAKKKVDEHQAKAKAEAEEQHKGWLSVVDDYKAKKAKVEKIADFPDAEKFVRDSFSVAQQSILMEVLDDAPVAVLALARNPAKAKDLAAIKSLPKFTKALVEMEKSMTVTSTKKPKAPPEKIITGGGSPAPDTTLEKLRAKAMETGDFTEVNAYKNKVKEAQRKKK